MELIIKNDYDAGSQWAAKKIVEAIKAKAEISEDPFVLGLATGSTPIGTYRELIRMHKAGEVSFKNVISFNMDEYVGLPVEHPESYHSFMDRYLFDHIDIPRERIHILNGNAPDLAAECENYEKMIAQAGGVDLFLGGVGENGHLAFNEPGASPDSRTRVVDLTEETRQVNSRFFDNDICKVPRQAMSVGIATVTDAHKVLILAFGAKKANALKKAVEGPVTEDVPLSILQRHPCANIVCDAPAASELNNR